MQMSHTQSICAKPSNALPTEHSRFKNKFSWYDAVSKKNLKTTIVKYVSAFGIDVIGFRNRIDYAVMLLGLNFVIVFFWWPFVWWLFEQYEFINAKCSVSSLVFCVKFNSSVDGWKTTTHNLQPTMQYVISFSATCSHWHPRDGKMTRKNSCENIEIYDFAPTHTHWMTLLERIF